MNSIMEVGVNETGVEVCTRKNMKIADFSKNKATADLSRGRKIQFRDIKSLQTKYQYSKEPRTTRRSASATDFCP